MTKIELIQITFLTPFVCAGIFVLCRMVVRYFKARTGKRRTDLNRGDNNE